MRKITSVTERIPAQLKPAIDGEVASMLRKHLKPIILREAEKVVEEQIGKIHSVVKTFLSREVTGYGMTVSIELVGGEEGE